MNNLPQRRIKNTLFTKDASRRITVKGIQVMRVINSRLLNRAITKGLTVTRFTDSNNTNINSFDATAVISTRRRVSSLIILNALLNNLGLISRQLPRLKTATKPTRTRAPLIRLFRTTISSLAQRTRRRTRLLQ